MLAYENLVSMLFDDSDRAKIEWAVGSALNNGPKKIVAICGPPATGKSTMLHIVENVFAFYGRSDDLVTMHDGLKVLDRPAYLFYASPNPTVTEQLGMIVAQTSGRVLPPHEHYRMMAEIESEMDDIGQICSNRYLALGPNYYETLFANNLNGSNQ